MLLRVFMCLCTSAPEPVSVCAPAVVSEHNPIRMKAAVINLISRARSDLLSVNLTSAHPVTSIRSQRLTPALPWHAISQMLAAVAAWKERELFFSFLIIAADRLWRRSSLCQSLNARCCGKKCTPGSQQLLCQILYGTCFNSHFPYFTDALNIDKYTVVSTARKRK